MHPTYPEVEQALLGRWPETRLDPSLDRIRALCQLLGDPQTGYPVIHLTGTNGKTSTARMIDALLRQLELRTGRFTSPHLQSMTERISIDGQPLTEEEFVDAFADVAAYAQIVDDSAAQSGGHPLSFFEMTVAMAYAAFADAPVDVAVVEVGMGGAWDATNVADGAVAVVGPVGVDHAAYLGDNLVAIAGEKAGIVKPGAQVVVAQQDSAVLDVIGHRAAEVGALMVVEGNDFGVIEQFPGVGGQQVSIQGLGARYDDIFVPLHGTHQAQNAACAVAAVESFLGGKALPADVVMAAFADVTSPGRLEIVRRSPTVILDAAHNPHGVEATVAAIQENFNFAPLVGVVAVMADKDVERILELLDPALSQIVCTQNSTPRSMSAAELADVADGIFGSDRVILVPRLDDALERAIGLAETAEGYEEALGSGGVLVTGSVVTVGEARVLLGGEPQ
jgi:dihydrofolate synthase/folylpolyglutamate synthase